MACLCSATWASMCAEHAAQSIEQGGKLACCCRAYDLPFQRHMGLPYSDFVLNIQPDDYQQLNEKIQFFLDNPVRLRYMQV